MAAHTASYSTGSSVGLVGRRCSRAAVARRSAQASAAGQIYIGKVACERRRIHSRATATGLFSFTSSQILPDPTAT